MIKTKNNNPFYNWSVCREVCKSWKVYVDVGTRFWSRIQAKSTHFGLTQLHLAASRGNIEVVGLILNSVDNNGRFIKRSLLLKL